MLIRKTTTPFFLLSRALSAVVARYQNFEIRNFSANFLSRQLIMKIVLVVAALAVCAYADPAGKYCSYQSASLNLKSLSSAPLLAEDSASRVPGEYVVIFDEDVSDHDGQFAPNSRSPTRTFRLPLRYT